MNGAVIETLEGGSVRAELIEAHILSFSADC